MLKAELDRLVEIDRELTREKQERALWLKRRDEKIRDVGKRVTGLRRMVAAFYDDPQLERLGFSGGICAASGSIPPAPCRQVREILRYVCGLAP